MSRLTDRPSYIGAPLKERIDINNNRQIIETTNNKRNKVIEAAKNMLKSISKLIYINLCISCIYVQRLKVPKYQERCFRLILPKRAFKNGSGIILWK